MKTKQILKKMIEPVITKLAKVKQTSGILCFGSYAIDAVDEKSDVDLLVLCRPNLPNESKRLEAIKGIEGSEYIEQEGEDDNFWPNEWSKIRDEIKLNDKIIEISYNTLDWVKNIICAVKETSVTTLPEMPFRPYTLLGLLENSIILFDPKKELQKLVDSLYPYPLQLKEKLIQTNLSICRDSLIDLSNYAKRDVGNMAFHFHFQRYLDSLYTLLFAINEKYDPATKRFEEYTKYFHIVPDRFDKRYKKVLVGPFDKDNRKKIVSELRAFINEIENYNK